MELGKGTIPDESPFICNDKMETILNQRHNLYALVVEKQPTIFQLTAYSILNSFLDAKWQMCDGRTLMVKLFNYKF